MEENKNTTNASMVSSQDLIHDLRQIIEQARGHVAWRRRLGSNSVA